MRSSVYAHVARQHERTGKEMNEKRTEIMGLVGFLDRLFPGFFEIGGKNDISTCYARKFSSGAIRYERGTDRFFRTA